MSYCFSFLRLREIIPPVVKRELWMIKVVFTYRTKKEALPELIDKFAQSESDPAFQWEASKGFKDQRVTMSMLF